MYDANEIALWFIYKDNSLMKEISISDDDLYEGISNLKLQKLLYYAQGIYLSISKNKLFKNKILAYQSGPIIKEIYEKYKHYEKKYIPVISTKENDRIVSKIENDYDVSNILNIVYDNFAIYTEWQLKNMTNEVGSPWYQTEINQEIPINIIEKYFNEVVMES